MFLGFGSKTLLSLFFIILVIFFIVWAKRDRLETFRPAGQPILAKNYSKDPSIVEIYLTANSSETQILKGNQTKLYNYNRPLIETKVGDILIVNFYNDMSETTSIRWHGLHVPSYPPIPPGGSCVYRFPIEKAGLFWYYSDVNSRGQLGRGLYGLLLAKNYREDDKYTLPPTEKILAFSDLNLDKKNQVQLLELKNDFEKDCLDITEEEIEQIFEKVNGIKGNIILCNNVYRGTILLERNIPVRIQMVNCCPDRFLKIHLECHDMIKIGGDQGLCERPLLIKADTGLILTTGERAEIIFVPRKENIKLWSTEFVGIQKTSRDAYGNIRLDETIDDKFSHFNREVLVTFNTEDTGREEALTVPLLLKPIRRIFTDINTPILPVSFGYSVHQGNLVFDIENHHVVIQDGTYIIEVTNTSPLPNNFYLHGFTFQHIETLYGKTRFPNSCIENKDTIYIPASKKYEKVVVRLAVTFRGKTGRWLFSSQIVTRAEAGQRGTISIEAECCSK